jgi:hypothetical protein
LGGVYSLSALPTDTVVVSDFGNGRLAFFVSDSGLVRTTPVEGRPSPYLARRFGQDGRILVRWGGAFRAFFEEPWVELPLISEPIEAGQLDTIGFYEVLPRLPDDIGFGDIVPFRAEGLLGAAPDGIVYARSDRAEVELRSPATGSRELIVRWDPGDRRPSDEQWNAELNRAEDDAARRRARTSFDGDLPTTKRVLGDDAGRIWVSRFAAGSEQPNRFYVFTRDGAYLGIVELPDRTEVLFISHEHVLALERTDLDVASVVLLPLLDG